MLAWAATADNVDVPPAVVAGCAPFDPAKNATNIATRGLSFERVAEFDWSEALLVDDNRRDYGERRVRVFALLDGRLHIAVITPRGGICVSSA